MGDNRLRTYTKKERNMYLCGMFGQNMIYNIISAGLIGFYLQSVIYIPTLAIGIIAGIARVWDAINVPMMGTFVDRTKSRWGKCRPYLIIFPSIIGLITILCFINGNYAQAGSSGKQIAIVAWAGISYILWGMLYTVGDIPLWGITSLMTEIQEDRSKLLSMARMVAGIGGIGTVISLVPQMLSGTVRDICINKGIIDAADPNADNLGMKYAFIIVVVIITIICTILFEFAGVGTKERVQVAEERHTMKENFKLMWQCKPFRQILISGILRSPMQLLMLVAISFVTYYYANGNFENLFKNGLDVQALINIVIIAVGVFAGQFISMGVMPSFIKKYEKKKLYNILSIGGAVPFGLLFLAYLAFDGDIKSTVPVLIAGVLLFLASSAMGGINVLQSVMIADCVDYEEYHHGIRPDGVFFSGQSFITKLSSGIASVIQGVAYSIIGFSDTNIEKLNADLAAGADFSTYNGGKYAMVMFFLIAVPPAIGMFISALPTLKYALPDNEHKKMLAELVERRSEKETQSAE